jgi:hypothetical protein
MKQIPRLYTLRQLMISVNGTEGVRILHNNEWVPARPLGDGGLFRRFKLAWKVFTGKADAVTWPGNQ